MRILFISYFYPPLGGPAALRNVKTVKYLSELGCIVDVISVGDIEYTYSDKSLLSETREQILIRTTSFDPMALLRKLFHKRTDLSQRLYRSTPERVKLLIRQLYPLDDKIGWLPPLLKAGNKALLENNYDLIYVSCGPFSSAIAAFYLAKKYRLPYVVEMRDYWTLLSDYNLQGSALNRWLSRYWENKILQSANGIVTVTKGIGNDLAEAFGETLKDKIHVLYNSHDETDYAALKPGEKQANRFILSYFGALYARRSLRHFYAALKELAAESKLPPYTEIRLFGNYNLEARQEIEQSGIESMIKIVPQLSHKEALQQMNESDALILVINSSSPSGTLTSKVFEYLRIGKPILAMIPAFGEAAELLAESKQNYICAMESRSSIKACLTRLIEERQGETLFTYPAEKYSRQKQVASLYSFLQKVCNVT